MSALWVRNSSGTWVNPSKPWVKDSGIWKVPQKVFAMAAGAWSLIWQSVIITLHGGSCTVFVPSGSGTATYHINSDGTEKDQTSTLLGDWINDVTQVGNYWVKATLSSGPAPTGGNVTGSWLQMNVSRAWSLTRSSVGESTTVLSIQLASDSLGATIVATASVTLDVTVSA